MHKLYLSFSLSLSLTHTHTPSESFVEIPRRVGCSEDDHRLRVPAGIPAPGLCGNAVHLDEQFRFEAAACLVLAVASAAPRQGVNLVEKDCAVGESKVFEVKEGGGGRGGY